jgi:photosystem II stability/assembly factor-like uncharacterized protein
MTNHLPQRRIGLLPAIAGVGMAAALVLTGCSQGPSAAAPGSPAQDLPSSHVHGVSRDLGSGKVNVATHEGLYVLQPDASWKQIGPVVDLMGFAVSAPGVFYASGHPGAGVDLPQPVGLMKSTDAGATWTVLSRGGESDFHALTASSKGVMGFDDTLRVTSDGKTWQMGGLSAAPRSLAAAPDGSRVLATTEQGVLSSTDGGGTWTPLVGAPLMLMTAWADAKTVVGVTVVAGSPEGKLAVSLDAGATWKIDLAKLSGAQAISASRDKAGVLEILVVTDKAVVQSRDNGATVTNLTT